jgi:DNA ligase-1
MAMFGELARLAEDLGGENGRLKKRAAIVDALTRIAAESTAEAGRFCLYLAGQPFAEADPRKLNAGGALLGRAVKTVSGCTDAALSAAYRRHGDLGAAAVEVLPANAEAASLTFEDIAEAFDGMSSARTTAVRSSLVEGLLRRATPLEAKYLLKLMLGDMRIGVKQSLVEEAIAVAAQADVVAVRHAVMLEADLGRAVEMAFAATLGAARMRLFHPLGFMLASPVETPEEAVARFTAKPEKVAKVKKPSRRKKPRELAVDAAEAGFAEDVEMVAGSDAGLSTAAAEDAAFGRDDSVVERKENAAEVVADPQCGGPSPSAQDDGERREASPVVVAVTAPVHAFLEDKYDGMRAQVHCGDAAQPGRVAIYSRNREDITESFPELAEAFAGVIEPLIFDGEILGWDLASKQALPFSVLGQRIGRKRVDNAVRRAIPVVFMAFDLLFAHGDLLLPLPLRERRSRLETVVARLSDVTQSPVELDEHAGKAQHRLFSSEAAPTEIVQRLRLSPACMVESAEAIDRAYADARARANEGVMLKAAESAYLPGRRGLAWVKLKRELATLDVVITGAEFGHGKRAGLLSDYTFAVRSAEGELLNVGKAYSGVTDVEIVELTAWLKEHTLEDHGHFRTVEPLRVLEVAFNNVMRSERHASGFALRFPRILRIRDDKPVSEIDTLERVEEIYQSQPDKGRE